MKPAIQAGRLALSSMWFQRWPDRRDLRPFFEAGASMGFEAFELSHDLPPEALEQLPEGVRLPSIHHPCPRDPALGPAQGLLSSDPALRRAAAAALGATIERAGRLGAEAVVLHLGQLEDADDTCRRLRFELEARHRAAQRDGRPYALALERLKGILSRKEPEHLDRAIAVLPPLLDQAARLGVRIGLETGYHAHELPTATGMRRLLDQLSAPGSIGAWLDTGHVAAREAIGIDRLDDWMAAVDGRWLGVHLHDCVGLRDHLVPGMGELDFAALARRFPASALRTCEIDWYFSAAEIASGLARLSADGWV